MFPLVCIPYGAVTKLVLWIFLSISSETDWKNDWKGKVVFSHGLTNSRGVVTLISPGIDISITDTKRDYEGRFLLIDCIIAECRYILVSLYAPIIDKVQEQISFGDYLLRALQNNVGENIIIGGDLNINLDKVQQDITLSKNLDYANKLQQLIELLNVVDVWRVKNPDTVQYT